MNYRPRTTIKGQALTNFIVEFTYSNTTEVAGTIGNVEAMKGVEMKKVERLRLRMKTLTMQNDGFMWMAPLTRTDR